MATPSSSTSNVNRNAPTSSVNRNATNSSFLKRFVLRVEFKNEKQFRKVLEVISKLYGKIDSFSISMHDKILTMVVADVDPTVIAAKLRSVCPVTSINYGPPEKPDSCVIL